VYRRSLENIALLWNNSALTSEQARAIRIYCDINGTSKLLKFVTDHKNTEVDSKIDNATVTLINHAMNGLSPYAGYSLMVEFGKNDKKITQPIYVYPFGVLPTLEKDDKKINRHMYGWNYQEMKWAKVPVVKCQDGSYAVAVKIVKE
jgi:hypothetical protein